MSLVPNKITTKYHLFGTHYKSENGNTGLKLKFPKKSLNVQIRSFFN